MSTSGGAGGISDNSSTFITGKRKYSIW
jgi:hypothetical protein